MADWETVSIDPEGGPVSVTVQAPDHPQLLYGKIWRYTEGKEPDGTAGWYSTLRDTVSLGPAAQVRRKRFVIIGVVVAHGDDPPTPYRVAVTFHQDGEDIHGPATPGDGGQGTVGDKEKAFTYHVLAQ